jgi:hypothetical protein
MIKLSIWAIIGFILFGCFGVIGEYYLIKAYKRKNGSLKGYFYDPLTQRILFGLIAAI